MFRMACLIVLVTSCWVLIECSKISTPDRLHLDRSDSGKSFDLAKGDSLEITLEGNPTTGYLWVLFFGNDSVLKSAGDYAFKQDMAPAGSVGVGGTFIFKFQAISKGTAHLEFGYQRPWEKHIPPMEAFQVEVRVR